MAAFAGLECAALTGAALAGFAGGRWLLDRLEFGRRAHAAFYDKMPTLTWLLVHGIPPLRGVAERLLSIDAVSTFADYLCERLESNHLTSTAQSLITLSLGALVVIFIGASAVAGSIIAGGAVVIAATAIGLSLAATAKDREIAALRAEIPDALRSMAVCSKAGLSLQQTLEQTASETQGKLRRLFETAARRLATGEAPEEALRSFRDQKGLSELSFVAVALDVQHQCGGALSTVLESACETVEGQLELERTLKVQTAQAKLSARIVTLMPFVLIALFSLMSSDFLTPFFSSLPGFLLFGVAMAMELAGVVIVRRMLKIEVE